jgi:hypothetical protein
MILAPTELSARTLSNQGAKMLTQSVYKVLLVLSVCLTSVVSQAEFRGADSRLRTVFRRPVIIGASVSAGFITESPGDRAARRYTAPENITNQAKSGASGREFTNINPTWAEQFSVVIAVDFLFWDSIQLDPTDSVRALMNLIASASQAGVPLVLGDIPQLLPNQVYRDFLNRQIHATCKVRNRCYILGLDRLHQQAVTDGIVINGRRYFYRDLTFDGLHLNAIGSEYAASMIIRLLAGD